MMVLLFVLKVIWFIAPAGIANMMPVFARPIFSSLAKPIDGNRKLGGEPIFGKNKTWRGLLVAVISGFLYFWLQVFLYQIDAIKEISIIDYNNAPLWWGAVMGFGAITGDLIKSFFKRRFKIPPGVSWFPLDQTDYTIGAILFLSPFFFPGWGIVAGVIGIGLVLHVLTNIIGHLVKLRKDWI